MVLIKVLVIGPDMPIIKIVVKVKMPTAQIVSILISLLLNMVNGNRTVQQAPASEGIRVSEPFLYKVPPNILFISRPMVS